MKQKANLKSILANISPRKQMKSSPRILDLFASKLRPWLEALKERCKEIPQEEHSAVDEVMIPFKGKSSVKQYMRNKPHKWGFKMWGRAGASGILYQFEVYQGAAVNVTERSPLGMTGEVVIRMTSTIPEGLNYKVFADNLFTSLDLVDQLNKRGILYVGTVRMNRLKGCKLKDQKTLKKEGRGSMDSKVEFNTGVIALRWYGNRTVDLVSSYVGQEPVREVKRFDRKEKKNIMVTCPKIVQEYNTFMGGIDLLDSLTFLYKTGVKSRRWYMYIWFHTLHIALVNAWLRYRRHSKLLGVPHHMKICTFQGRIAGSLVSRKQTVGRPRATDFSPPPSRTVRRGLLLAEVCLDQVSHLPEWAVNRGRCKNRNCAPLTYVMCSKCREYAGFVKERNTSTFVKRLL
ncbi:piggyBac transposable element-derived protein 3-like [Haliotis cracherodii]|uniref:piggyBac transposable element-derived protein 3-like n=1 Tax=Haliotis cracherodii TaxID=6455 RepID=UPI0039E968A9